MDDNQDTTNNGFGSATADDRRERMRRRAREAKDTALGAISDTPGWVWAVVGGVLLLMIGIMAASRYRSRHAEHHD